MSKETFVLHDDIGFVNLVKASGGDIDVVNAARVSFGKRADLLTKKDEKLIVYLAQERHTSPFEHVTFTFHVKCPLFIARQWHRHRTWSYNEVSRRYTGENIEFFLPEGLRSQSDGEDKQQSVGGSSMIRTLDIEISDLLYSDIQKQPVHQVLRNHALEGLGLYNLLIKQGVAREQARMVLPQNMYTEFYATVNLHNLMHFIGLRFSPHAQFEMQLYAGALLDKAEEVAPISVMAMAKAWQWNKEEWSHLLARAMDPGAPDGS